MSQRAPGGVIVVGSANVDLTVRVSRLPSPGETVTGGVFSRQPGGKGANQAVAAARYGARTRFVGAVGDDPLADEIVAALGTAGVETGGVVRLTGVGSGVALIVVDTAGENQIAVASGANGALSATDIERALASVGAEQGTICLVGFEIGDAAVMAAAGWARAAGAGLVVNPAPARPLPPGLVELQPILTPNRGEAAVLTGEDDPASAAIALVARTGAPVVITLGAEGALVADTGGHTSIPAPSVVPLDATGAGDAFNGVLSAVLASGASVHEAVQRAVVAASLSTQRIGAQAGMPTRAEVEAILRT